MKTNNTFKTIALLSAFYLTGCASTYQLTRGIDRADIKSNGYTAYENKSQELVLFDKAGGLEADLNSEWQKLPNANLSDFASNPRLNAEEVVTHNRETKETTQEAIVFYRGPDGNKYELTSSDGKYKIEKKSDGAIGGGGGGSGGGGAGAGGQ